QRRDDRALARKRIADGAGAGAARAAAEDSLTHGSLCTGRASRDPAPGSRREADGRCDRVTREAISQHLRVLKQAGLVGERREGTRRYHRARPEGLDGIRPFLEEMWDDSLALLKAAAEPSAPWPMRARSHSSPVLEPIAGPA